MGEITARAGRCRVQEDEADTMSQDKLEQKIKDAKHQRKTDEASVVLRDKQGNWILEMYCGENILVQVKGTCTTP